jgi:amino acid transporter
MATLLGLGVLIGFTLAVPSLDTASHHATPILYIIGSYFPNYVVVAALTLVSVAIFACVLANLTTLTRLVWAMARDGQVPASRFLAKVSVHKVPANAIWVVIPVTAIFTIWAQIEVVIIAICTFAMYATYGMVVAAVIWGKNQRADQRDVQERKHVSHALCVAALIWIVSIMVLLVIISKLTMTHEVFVETVIGSVLLGIFGAIYYSLWGKKLSNARLTAAEQKLQASE